MAPTIKFDFSNTEFMASKEDVAAMSERVVAAKKTLLEKTGEGNDFLGWIDLPVNYDKDEFARIKKAADKIKSDSEVLIVIGIGGSYLGARATIEALGHSFYNSVSKEVRKTPEIYYCGNNISSTYLSHLMDVIGDRDFSVNVISKSGTTTEPAIAFRIMKKKLEAKYGKAEAAKRIYATTDAAKGALKTLATEEGYETFVVPDDVGGRFSVLTAVGLLPIAVSGADIDKLMQGAANAREYCIANDFDANDAMKYAAVRNVLHEKGLGMEILANYEPALHYVAEWWKQLYGESEGKDGKGIFPTAVDFTTDLHSLGQFIQEGTKNHFETVINVLNPKLSVVMEEEPVDLDGLNYLTGKEVDFINKCAMNGTILAHVDGGVPNILVNMETIDETSLGELFYVFEFACGMSGYVLGVNPFNQPGVESYKSNMFALLGKPGNEAKQAELLARLGK
ncbi:MAG: glucose-6-phosphate isomerase [Lachnospiraceae bacterium]|nr:glucose-6-phosphate isomerase [Lachnospiraceae bacterium]MBR3599413.1 glucose-6-phosphate isomerase [Lachnospiraceae bacterium]